MFLRTFIVLCLVFFHFQGILINAWPTLQVTILNYTQTYASEYVEFSMLPSNKSMGAYDVHINVLRGNIKPIVRIGIFFENVEFMNKTVNICKVAHTKKSEPLLKLIFKVLTENKKAKLPKECPIKKDKYYNFLLVETDQIPPVWPENRVTIYIDFFSSESDRLVPILSQFIHCQFKRKRNLIRKV